MREPFHEIFVNKTKSVGRELGIAGADGGSDMAGTRMEICDGLGPT